MYKISFYDKIGAKPLWIELPEESKEFEGKTIKEITEFIMDKDKLTVPVGGVYGLGINLKRITCFKIERV